MSRADGAILWLSTITGPGLARSQVMHWLMMRLAWRSSSTAHQVTVVKCRPHAHRDVEVQAVVDFVGLFLSQIPLDTGAAQHDAGKAEFRWPAPATPRRCRPCAASRCGCRSAGFRIRRCAPEAVGEVLDEIEQADPARARSAAATAFGILIRLLRNAACGPADRDRRRPVGNRPHARPRHRLVHVEQILAFAEGVQEHGHGADVEGLWAPRNSRWLRIRVISSNMTRMYWARTGTSMPSRRSTASNRRARSP